MIDWQWMEYLTQMEQFREGIGLRAYGQRDPLVEYKNEAFEMFNELTERIQGSIVSQIFRVVLTPVAPAPAPPPARQLVESGPGDPDGSNGAEGKRGSPQKRTAPARAAAVPVGAAAGAGEPTHKIGRNDPCWCGSGKKYKRCHGR
jgi:preprotein translocase subunit SecA